MAPTPATAPMTTPSTVHFLRYEADDTHRAARAERARTLLGVDRFEGRCIAQRSHPVLQSCSGTSPADSASCANAVATER